nr:hypothetical protein Iba_chr12aCG4820 [Ipomoea batatas]GMD62904.1 hypothetical protein Iba_chr12bCG9860 [Ipomoea batatas]GMD65606.1 hypothetical protein Iba_chr12cCG6990 [Ipomoea batatas]GMD72087.1 hypothetical protein Iba_chr12fCG5200 [Ipomoea batatas]
MLLTNFCLVNQKGDFSHLCCFQVFVFALGELVRIRHCFIEKERK